jgi:protoheme IX farnesyltransferase
MTDFQKKHFAKVSDFWVLAKPRVMVLAIFTAFVGMVIAPKGIHPVSGVLAIIAIALGSGSSGALNMWYEAKTDALMSRTLNRPIPAGRLSSNEALTFGLVVATISIGLLAASTNLLSAALLAFTIFFYVVIYTMWLKFSTPQNIVIGGAAGALPPVIGWAAATGTVGPESAILFLIIFLWTPPHFWALALFKSGDYELAAIPMLPNVAGKSATRKQIFIYSLTLMPAGLMPWLMGFASIFYGMFGAILGAIFLWRAWKVLRTTPDDLSLTAEKRLFVFSILYLFLIFGALLVDSGASHLSLLMKV